MRHQRLREAERRLVAQQHLRARREGLRERHHLLLAAAQVARLVVQLLAQDRKHLEGRAGQLLERRGAAMHGRAEADVVRDCQVRKHAMAIEHEAQAAPREFLRVAPSHIGAVEMHRSAGRLDEPDDGAQQRRLAGAVRAEHEQDFAGTKLQD